MLNRILLSAGAILCLASTAAAADVAKGKEVYNGAGACATCHGPEGKGDGPAGASLDPKPKSFAADEFAIDTDGDGKTGTETDIFNVITKGAQEFGGSVFMVGRPDLSEEDRKALTQYILSLKK